MTPENCIHHWMITKDGLTGCCKKCGAAQTYPARLTPAEYRENMKQVHREIRAAREPKAAPLTKNQTGGAA